MKIIIVGFDGQLGLDCQKVLSNEHQLLTPTLAELDLCDKEKTTSYITSQQPDVIINCAAFTAVDDCEVNLELCRKVNSAGPSFLAQASNDVGCRLIHVSTDYVFDGMKPIPQAYSEDDQVNPLSNYGLTKLEGEKQVQKHSRDYAILRTAWLYSAHGPNFLKTMLRISLDDPDSVRKVVNDQYGSLTWSYTLAKQIKILLHSDIQGIVHTTSNGYSTWYEAACYFLDKMGVKHNIEPCTTSEYPRPAHRPVNSILANTLLEEKNNSVFVDWKDDLDEYVKLHRDELFAELQ